MAFILESPAVLVKPQTGMGGRVSSVPVPPAEHEDIHQLANAEVTCKKKDISVVVVSVCALVLAATAVVIFVVHGNPESWKLQLDEHDKQLKAIWKMLPKFNNTKDCRKDEEKLEQRDCLDVLRINTSAESGVYTIYPEDQTGMKLSMYCDMTTQGGGWIVFQRREDGSEDFYRTWEDYKVGFGMFDGEFWLGLDKIHLLVSKDDWELLINMRYNGNEKYAIYRQFYVGPEGEGYPLTVGNYSGDAGDSLSWHNDMRFSTKDRDYDNQNGTNCAKRHFGAWWYNNCHHSNLNGMYNAFEKNGPRWLTFSGSKPVEFVEMKMKRMILI